MNSIICSFLGIAAVAAFNVAAAAPYGAPNLLPNGDFKGAVRTLENLWDGVDSGNYLNGKLDTGPNNGHVYLLRLSGGAEMSPVPVSVNAVDLNGDGLLDLVVASNSGYIFCFFNSGSKTEPKFTHAEVLPLYLARGYFGENGRAEYDKCMLWRRAIRINFCDWERNGRLDLLVGNYRGELLLIPNKGMPNAPEFRQPPLDQANVLATKNRWGNLFAPVAYDFDHDGKVDVAVGEGSYSANSVYLFQNRGSNSQPKFDDSARSYLAFGDGREQLAPALVDYNGDGFMDLLVADREGKVGVYLNPGASWKPGSEFPLSDYVSFGGSKSLGEAVTVSAADLNGDGLFDLIFGKANGHIAVAYNKGTKTEPKFSPPEDLKGEKLFAASLKQPTETSAASPNSLAQYPAGWSVNAGTNRGNPYGIFTLVSNEEDSEAAAPDNRLVLKACYLPSPNKVFKTIIPVFPGIDEKEFQAAKSYQGYGQPNRNIDLFGSARAQGAWMAWGYPSDCFVARCILPQNSIAHGKHYRLSFNVKGANFSKGQWRFAYLGRNKHEQKQIHGDRGSVDIINIDDKIEIQAEEGNFSPSGRWTEVSKSFSVTFKEPDLKNPDKTAYISPVLEIRASLKPCDGVLYIDNVQLVETR